MRPQIDEVLNRHGQVATRKQLLAVLTRGEFDDEVARGHLVAPFPRTYCRPWDADIQEIRERAAVRSVGRQSALSHISGLRRYELPAPESDQIHVTTTIQRHPIGRAPALVVHRTRVPTSVRRVNGVLTVAPATAIVRSWPMITGPDQRAPAIVAVRDRRVTTERLAAAWERTIGMPQRRRLGQLIALLDAGCRSALEIWGFLGVFDVNGLRHAVRQRAIPVRGTTYWLDLAYEEERLAVELDGERYHSTKQQRERDRRRDAALATLGWQTLRFSHDRLHFDVDGCRRDTLATLEARRVWPRSR